MVRAVERFSIESHKTKTKLITTTSRKKRKCSCDRYLFSLKGFTKSAGNASDQVVIGFSFASDWLRD